MLLLDISGTVVGVQQAGAGKGAGFWIDRETYDGVNAATKGWKKEFWAWNESKETLSRISSAQ